VDHPETYGGESIVVWLDRSVDRDVLVVPAAATPLWPVFLIIGRRPRSSSVVSGGQEHHGASFSARSGLLIGSSHELPCENRLSLLMSQYYPEAALVETSAHVRSAEWCEQITIVRVYTGGVVETTGGNATERFRHGRNPMLSA